jgi:hypothetical protein
MVSQSETSKIMQLYCLFLSFVYEFVCCYLLHYCDDATISLEIMAESSYILTVLAKLGKATTSFNMSVRPFISLHRTTLLPLDGVL